MEYVKELLERACCKRLPDGEVADDEAKRNQDRAADAAHREAWSLSGRLRRVVEGTHQLSTRLRKAAQAGPREQREKEAQHQQDKGLRHVAKRRCKRGTQALAHVHDRVDANGMLQDWHASQRGPRVIDAAKKRDRHDDYAEDQADLLGLHGSADETGQALRRAGWQGRAQPPGTAHS